MHAGHIRGAIVEIQICHERNEYPLITTCLPAGLDLYGVLLFLSEGFAIVLSSPMRGLLLLRNVSRNDSLL